MGVNFSTKWVKIIHYVQMLNNQHKNFGKLDEWNKPLLILKGSVCICSSSKTHIFESVRRSSDMSFAKVALAI